MFSRPFVAALGLAAATALAVPAAAATFAVPGSVTSTSVNPLATFPPIGQAATVTIEVTGADGDVIASEADLAAALAVDLSIPGFLSAGFFSFVDSFSLSTTALILGTPEGAPTLVSSDAGVFTTTTSFRATFGSAVAAAPATVGELIAALSLPGLTGRYSISGTGPGSNTESANVVVEYAATAPVPLPAGAPVLLSALAAMGILRLRGRRAA